METGNSPALPAVELDHLTAIVRRCTGSVSFQIIDWQIRQLGGGIGNPVSVGLYRLQGSGWAAETRSDWSVILKVIQSPANVGQTGMGEGDDLAHWNYWKRELWVYRSDFLQTLPDGLAAPRCYGVEERPGQMAWLWLEDISDSLGGNWSLERYALAARHLGRLNGKYASGAALPDFPWLGQNLVLQWMRTYLPELRSLRWDHPQVQADYPGSRPNPFRRMLAEVERFQAEIAKLPMTICHGDTYPTNLMSRVGPDGAQQTIALDWALMQRAPLGDDLAQLVFGAQMNLKGIAPFEIQAALFENYVAGLRDSGCRADPQLVRLGFVVAGVLRVGVFNLLLMGSGVQRDDSTGAVTAAQPEFQDRFEVTMAAEAYRLLELLETNHT
jgi:hypothetical protein